jgi:hypothetical protein
MMVPKYNRETNPSVWLEDGRGAPDDLFIIKNLPLYLVESARTWLEHLPCGKNNSYAELCGTFIVPWIRYPLEYSLGEVLQRCIRALADLFALVSIPEWILRSR